MLRIGLTGGIASGKSTVSNMLKDRDFPIVDADVCAREVVEPGENAYKKVVETFGVDILNQDATINRKRLGQIIFNDEQMRKTLNGIVHPEVRMRMLEKVADYERAEMPAVILDIPLLIESKLMDWVDKVIVVYVPRDVQIERLMARDQSTMAEALSRINSQLPLNEKRRFADCIIDNSGTIEDTKQQLDSILERWGLTK